MEGIEVLGEPELRMLPRLDQFVFPDQESPLLYISPFYGFIFAVVSHLRLQISVSTYTNLSANYLTSTGMTYNRMHVKIETQREKRAGGSIETLDIYIADLLGARSYEMFSGGEAFRINFALRVAISLGLTRRVGAPLRILFVDEGFGT